MPTTDVTADQSRDTRSAASIQQVRGAGIVTVVLACAVLLLAAQVHHWISPHDSSGARGDLVPLLVTAPLAWLVVFGIALIRPQRADQDASVSRRYALGFGIVAVPCIVLAYWTPVPWALGVAAVLLVRRARIIAGDRERIDLVAQVLGCVAITAPVLIFVGVLIAARH